MKQNFYYTLEYLSEISPAIKQNQEVEEIFFLDKNSYCKDHKAYHHHSRPIFKNYLRIMLELILGSHICDILKFTNTAKNILLRDNVIEFCMTAGSTFLQKTTQNFKNHLNNISRRFPIEEKFIFF